MVAIHAFVVPVQAYAFLGAVAAFLVLLVVFFLYLNKQLCFADCGGFPCIDAPPKKETSKGNKLDHTDGQPIVKKHKSYGAGSGSAYAYDDQDTSSDSDDEVLRRYQENLQRVPSQRSVRSGRSQKSAVSKASHGGRKKDENEQDQLMSLAEKGGKDESSADESDPELASSVVAASAVSKQSTPAGQGSEAGNAAVANSHTYKNEAFQEDGAISPEKGSHASSEQALSGDGDSASMSVADVDHDEHLFDVSDLQDREPVLISKCGSLEVTFKYSFDKSRMTVAVHQAREIPTKDRGGANNTQVRLLLLPTKKVRHKTKIKPGENPDFQETFQFKVPPEELNNMGLRFRLYGCERMRRERMIGESVVGFASLNHDTETTHWLTLEPRSNLSHGDSKLDVSSLSRSDSASSTQSMQHGGMPELLIGLSYNGTTGRLSVEVIKGSNFRNMAMNRAPDTYVKLTLMSPNGQEIARSKTSIRRGQPNPLYKETFMFQVALFQLPDVTLMVSVYNKRSMKRKEMIGWFSLGLNNSGEEELSHWNDMRESKGEQVCRWHVLLES